MKQKLIFSFIFLLGWSSCSLSSCGENNKEMPEEIRTDVNVKVSEESLAFGPDASTSSITVTADADWAIKSDEEWISVKPSGGLRNQPTEVTLSVNANPEMAERTAHLEISSRGQVIKDVPVVQSFVKKASPSVTSIVMGASPSDFSLKITANADWKLSSDAAWISISPDKGNAGETDVTVTAAQNSSATTREAIAILNCDNTATEIKITQFSDAITTPEGYQLVWNDEFNEGTAPGKEWVLENWPAGYVNNELQIYTSKKIDGKSTIEIKDGVLNITCFKGSDGKIYSGRMNACPSTGWLYGYFEARILLPKGKGTWPAFWMMPANVDWNQNPWPRCGEIDIMEEVGANPDYVSSSLHTEKYNHTKGTQITHEMKCPGAEETFHVYALEWTPEEIITYVDGKVQLRASKAALGESHDCWPFHYPFYPILNLAWGGDWGGYKGVDESALPATMKVDYVRIFQKK